MKDFKFIDLFSGIDGFHQAASASGGKCLFASELDGEAKKAYEANYVYSFTTLYPTHQKHLQYYLTVLVCLQCLRHILM